MVFKELRLQKSDVLLEAPEMMQPTALKKRSVFLLHQFSDVTHPPKKNNMSLKRDLIFKRKLHLPNHQSIFRGYGYVSFQGGRWLDDVMFIFKERSQYNRLRLRLVYPLIYPRVQ